MKLKEQGLFHTPDSWHDLIEWIEQHPKELRPHLLTAAGMAWNLAAKIQKETAECE